MIHDWDSVVAMPEAVLAGNSAFTYVSVLDCEISSMAQNDEFLAAYAAERGRAWTELEWQVAHAAGAWVGAYNAAFEHLKGGPGPVTAGLREQAEEAAARAPGPERAGGSGSQVVSDRPPRLSPRTSRGCAPRTSAAPGPRRG